MPVCDTLTTARFKLRRRIGTPRGHASSLAGRRGVSFGMHEEDTMTAHRPAKPSPAKGSVARKQDPEPPEDGVASGSPVRDSGTRSTAPHVHCGSARSFSWPAWCWRHWSPFGSGYDFLCRQERRSTMRYETPAKTPRRRVARFSAGQVTLSELCRKFVTKPTARWTVAGLRAFRQVGPVLESSFDTSRTSRYSIGLRGVVCPDLQPP